MFDHILTVRNKLLFKGNDPYILLPHPSGGAADQSGGAWDQVAGGGSRDAWKTAESTPHRHRGHGGSRDGPPSFPLSPSLTIPFTVICPILPQQEAGERLSVQAASRSELAGAEANQEVTIEGCKEGELTPPSRRDVALHVMIIIFNCLLLVLRPLHSCLNWA